MLGYVMKDFTQIILGDDPNQTVPVCKVTVQELIDETVRLNNKVATLTDTTSFVVKKDRDTRTAVAHVEFVHNSNNTQTGIENI
jgi:hypothetical protein